MLTKKIANILDNKKIEILFSLVLILGTFFRFYGLNIQSLWIDEFYSYLAATHSLQQLLTQNLDQWHPPAYYILLHFTIALFGDSEIALRLPAAMAGSLAIVAIFLLGKKLYSKKEGLIAASMMAFSLYPIHYSQESRSYSLLLLFSIISIYFLFDIFLFFKKKIKYHSQSIYFSFAGYILSAIMLAYISYMGVYFVALQGLFFGLSFIKRPKILLYLALVYLMILLSYVPWLGFYFNALQRQGPSWIPAIFPLFTLKTFAAYHIGLGQVARTLAPIVAFLIIMATLLFLSLNYKNFLRASYFLRICRFCSNVSLASKVLLLWAIVPYAIVYFKSSVSQSILIPRAMIFIIPAIYLLEARVISRIKFNKIIKFLIAMVVGVFLFFSMTLYYTTPDKAQFREMAVYVVKKDQKLNSMLICRRFNDIIFGINYYLEKFGLDKECYTIKQIQKQIKKEVPQYFWVMSADESLSPKFFNLLQESLHLKLLSSKLFLKAEAYLYENLDYQ